MAKKSATPDLEETTRRSAEAFDRRDFDAAVAVFMPDAVWDASPVGLGVFEGRDAIRGLFEDLRGPYEDYEQVIEEFRDLGNGVTFGAFHQRGRLPGSSGSVEVRYAAIFFWKNGLVERSTAYTDIDGARADAERLADERGG
jgi:ketosteroid isomerase-like protein